jgi:Tfp pilus assembly protein PilE
VNAPIGSSKVKGANRVLSALTNSSHPPAYPESINQLYQIKAFPSMWKATRDTCLMCVLNSTHKRTNRLQYSVCKCEVESTRKWSNIGVLLNQPHFNLVPKV